MFSGSGNKNNINQVDALLNRLKDKKAQKTETEGSSQSSQYENSSTLTVCEPGFFTLGKRFNTIAEAIRFAKPNAEIVVLPGVYRESLVIDKPLRIVGSDREDTIIESLDSPCILSQVEDVFISNLTLLWVPAYAGDSNSAIEVSKGILNLAGCNITSSLHFDRKASYGVQVQQEGRVIIKDSNITNVSTGIGIQSKTNSLIKNCKIHDIGCGIQLEDLGQGTIEGCEILNSTFVGVEIDWSTTLTEDSQEVELPSIKIRNCQICDGEHGIFIDGKVHVVVEECLISRNEGTGISVGKQSEAEIRNSEISFEKQTGVSFSDGSSGIMEGCRIFANGEKGIYIERGASPIISNCRIFDGESSGVCYKENIHKKIFMGRGFFFLEEEEEEREEKVYEVYNSISKGIVKDCAIYNNKESGIEICDEASPTIQHCQINQNQVGIKACRGGTGIVQDCDLTGNANGAWSIDSSSSIRRSNNKQ